LCTRLGPFILSMSLISCTTLVAHTTIDPYLSDKEKRENLQAIAAKYCQLKLSGKDTKQPVTLPDYPFTTDGCSRWFDQSWVSCCVVHDIMYWCGGSEKDRVMADSLIKQCADKKVAMMGDFMYPGVRLGGSPWLPTPWRWGYGWKQWPNGYQPSRNEQDIKAILDKLHIPEIIEEQLK
jgi:hypothetical protein